jgi:hypothetical protein
MSKAFSDPQNSFPYKYFDEFKMTLVGKLMKYIVALRIYKFNDIEFGVVREILF